MNEMEARHTAILLCSTMYELTTEEVRDIMRWMDDNGLLSPNGHDVVMVLNKKLQIQDA